MVLKTVYWPVAGWGGDGVIVAGARHPGATGGWYLDAVSWQGGGGGGGGGRVTLIMFFLF